MTDSSSFTSLLALVDSHLSKCSLQASETPGTSASINIPPLNGSPKSLSNTTLPSLSEIFPSSSFGAGYEHIKVVLAAQLSNTLDARKRQETETHQEIHKKTPVTEEDDDFIDLVKAIQEPEYHYAPNNVEESRASTPDFPLLDSDEFKLDDEPKEEKKSLEYLPCKTDMSYILKLKVRKGKCSAFGKVLTAKYRKVAAPYLRERYESKVKRFDFKLKSPCDCIAEKLRRPTTYSLPNHVRFGMFDVKPIINTPPIPSL